MEHDRKKELAMTGNTESQASALRLVAARKSVGMSQVELGKAAGISKSAVNNAEKGQSFAGRSVMIYLYNTHRIDTNFMICGEFSQLPGDVQDKLFIALENEHDARPNLLDPPEN